MWQHQLGNPMRLRGAIRIGLSYRYELREGARLADYNMEAQGELLADYFVLRHLGERPKTSRTPGLAQYEAVLEHFLLDPGSRANLPRAQHRFARLAKRQ